MNEVMKKIMTITLQIIILIFCFQFCLVSYGQSEQKMTTPAPNGILIFVGMELANGINIDQYIIERSYNNQKWEPIAELSSPRNWEEFQSNYIKWKSLFGFQGDPQMDDLKRKWQLCEKANVIDSMGYWTQLTAVRLASGLAYYDQKVTREKQVWYRIKAMKNGKSISKKITSSPQYPFIPQFDPLFINDRNIDKSIIYLKWESTGNNPAPYFKVQYYEDTVLKQGDGFLTQYTIENVKYVIYQDSIRKFNKDRQYFLNPLDFYGNPSYATDIELVSKSSSEKSFFQNTKALTDTKGFGIILNWKMVNPKLLKGIKIFKSDAFDGKEYELIATIPSTDTTYTDRNVLPDKMYYYFLETINTQNDPSQKSNIFFNVAYDQLKPVYPTIRQGKEFKNGATIIVKSSEMNVAGVKIYRNNGFSEQLFPITDILSLKNNEVIFVDTSSVLSGDKSYLYAATCVNNSSVESDFSDTITIHPSIKTNPISPNRFSVYEENGSVQLVWEDLSLRSRLIKGYQIFRRDLPVGKFIQLSPKDSIIDMPIWTDFTAQPGKSYEYAVQTIDELGGVSETMALCSITLKEFHLPTPPNVWGTYENGIATIQWGDCSRYQNLKLNLYRYQRGGKPQLIKTCDPMERKWIDQNVKKGNLYFYYSTFCDDKKNESAPSQETSVRIP